jgi:hypothetical protein
MGMGHGAWGMGMGHRGHHRASGMGSWATGHGHRVKTPGLIRAFFNPTIQNAKICQLTN